MIWIIIGMSIVTVLPRIIPAFIVEKMQYRPWVNRWLASIPYAALGALIFPGILAVRPEEPQIGLIGGVVAAVLAFMGLNVVLVVIGAILTVFLFSL
ncbi:AzlD domain-containing protein [Oceanobacillus massiliensis]|uniref:AzlD domain-containing protein n=1 Tax=Oceanobacillus massiliensis TaxID=1465765 RepID=UPI0002885A96|nr:AzlD domain-containing protein [Oceanobacillus massiliensis]